MAEIIWTEPALNDLDRLAEHIAVSNVKAAKKLVQTLFEKVDRLETHPKSGKKLEELPNLDYRELVIEPCRIFYKYDTDKIYILHVMRQEQELRIYRLEHQ